MPEVEYTWPLYKARLATGEWFTSDDVPLVGTNDEWRRMPGGATLQLQVAGGLPFLPDGTKALTDVFPDVRDSAHAKNPGVTGVDVPDEDGTTRRQAVWIEAARTGALYHARTPNGPKLTARWDGREWPLCGTEAEWRRMVAGELFQLELVGALPFLPDYSVALSEHFPAVRDPADPPKVEQDDRVPLTEQFPDVRDSEPLELGKNVGGPKGILFALEREVSWIDVELDDDDHLLLNMTADQFWALPTVFKGTTSFVQIDDRWINTDRIQGLHPEPLG